MDKLRAYSLQDRGLDTVEANLQPRTADRQARLRDRHADPLRHRRQAHGGADQQPEEVLRPERLRPRGHRPDPAGDPGQRAQRALPPRQAGQARPQPGSRRCRRHVYDADAGSARRPHRGRDASTRARSTRPGCASASWSRGSTTSSRPRCSTVPSRRSITTGVGADDIEVVWVPGAFEIPIAARELAQHGGVDAVVCLGAVIRGDTAAFRLRRGRGSARDRVGACHHGRPCDLRRAHRRLPSNRQSIEPAASMATRAPRRPIAAVEMVSLLRELRAPAATERRAVS